MVASHFLGQGWIHGQVVKKMVHYSSVQFSSVARSCLTLCDPMNCSMPGLPVCHHLPEFTQTCPSSRWCHPAISSSVVPFSSCPQSLPASVFSNESTLCMRWPKYWSLSFSIIPSKNTQGWSPLEWTGSQESSPAPQFKSINPALSFLHSPTLTSIHDHRKNHSLD